MTDTNTSGESAGGAAAVPPPVRVIVVARQPVARAGLRALVEDFAEVVGLARSGADLPDRFAERTTDVVIALSDELGTDRDLAEFAAVQGVPVIFLLDSPAGSEIRSLLGAGVRGLLPGEVTVEEVQGATQAVVQGLLVVDPQFLVGILSQPAAALASGDLPAGDTLTEREQEVLALLALGLPNKTIARRLTISEHTVKFHVGSILAKLGAGSRTEAVSHAARRGLLAL